MMLTVNSGRNSAAENMRRDGELLEELGKEPVLHLYEWASPSATYGYFTQPGKFLNLEAMSRRGLELARRPTGGGIVFHLWDLAFSFLMPSTHPAFSPNTLENYRFVNEVVLDVVKEQFSFAEMIPDSFPAQSADCAHFCMARPTQYDVVYQGRKIAGAAQRRRKQGYLHQGTISLAPPDPELLKEVLLSPVLEPMLRYSFALPTSRSSLQKLLTEKLDAKLSSNLSR